MRAQPDPPPSVHDKVTLCAALKMPPGMLAVVTGSWQSALVVKLKAAGWTRPFPATSVAPAPMATREVVLQASRSLGLMASALAAGASVNVRPWSMGTAAGLSVAAFIA